MCVCDGTVAIVVVLVVDDSDDDVNAHTPVVVVVVVVVNNCIINTITATATATGRKHDLPDECIDMLSFLLLRRIIVLSFVLFLLWD